MTNEKISSKELKERIVSALMNVAENQKFLPLDIRMKCLWEVKWIHCFGIERWILDGRYAMVPFINGSIFGLDELEKSEILFNIECQLRSRAS